MGLSLGMEHTFAVVGEVYGQRRGHKQVSGQLLPDNLTDENHTQVSMALRERGRGGGVMMLLLPNSGFNMKKGGR